MLKHCPFGGMLLINSIMTKTNKVFYNIGRGIGYVFMYLVIAIALYASNSFIDWLFHLFF